VFFFFFLMGYPLFVIGFVLNISLYMSLTFSFLSREKNALHDYQKLLLVNWLYDLMIDK
jgi:hypothetical protein